MNRTRQQIKAAKARKEWQRLQEQELEEKEIGKTSNLKKVKSADEEDPLRGIA